MIYIGAIVGEVREPAPLAVTGGPGIVRVVCGSSVSRAADLVVDQPAARSRTSL